MAKKQGIVMELDIRPLAMPRPRFTRNGHTYMPKIWTKYKDSVGFLALQAMSKARAKILKGELGVEIDFYFKRKPRGDIDNYIKALLDSLTGITYEDDKQIISIDAVINIAGWEGISVSIKQFEKSGVI